MKGSQAGNSIFTSRSARSVARTYDEGRLKDGPDDGPLGEHEGKHADVERPGRGEGREQREVLRETLAQLQRTAQRCRGDSSPLDGRG